MRVRTEQMMATVAALTEVPARIGTWMSKTMIRAVKADASSTGWVCGHSTLPVSRWMGSIAVRYSVRLDPAAAHGTLSVSVSIAANTIRPTVKRMKKKNKGRGQTFYNGGLVSREDTQAFADLYKAATDSPPDTCSGALSFEYVGNWKT